MHAFIRHFFAAKIRMVETQTILRFANVPPNGPQTILCLKKLQKSIIILLKYKQKYEDS